MVNFVIIDFFYAGIMPLHLQGGGYIDFGADHVGVTLLVWTFV